MEESIYNIIPKEYTPSPKYLNLFKTSKLPNIWTYL